MTEGHITILCAALGKSPQRPDAKMGFGLSVTPALTV